MIRALAFFLAFQLCACEQKIVCASRNESVFIEGGETVRFTSNGYPSGTGYSCHHKEPAPCRENFTTADGYRLKISFINGYLPKGVILGGLDGAEGSSELEVNFDTSKDASLENYRQTFHASQNLSFQLKRGCWNARWVAFEAIIRSYAVDGTSSCSQNETIDLSEFDGPVDFGSEWRNGSDAKPNTCSWTITSPPNMVMKLAAKRISLRDGEYLKVTSSQQDRTITANEVLTFANETQITVTYERRGGDSDQYGILLHASAYEHRGPSSDDCEDQFNHTIVVGGNDYAYDIYVLLARSGYNSRTPYSNNQRCKWMIEVPPNQEIEVTNYGSVFELGADRLIMSTPDTPNAYEITSMNTGRHFLLSNNSTTYLNFTWETDGNVAMDSLEVYLTATKCICYPTDAEISANDQTWVSNVIRQHPVCQNMQSSYKFRTKKGYVFLFEVGYVELPLQGDGLTIEDGENTFFSYHGIQNKTTMRPLLTTSDTFTITEKRGIFTSDNQALPNWDVLVRRVPASFSMKDSVILTDAAPTAYTSLSEFLTWNVKATQNIRVHLRKSTIHVLEYFETVIEIHDGDENAPTINITETLTNEEFITSSGNELTIVRNFPLTSPFDDDIDDAFIYVEDTRNWTSCSASASVMHLNKTDVPFQLVGSADKSCHLTLLGDFFGVYELFHKWIHISAIAVHLGLEKEPVRIFAGSFQDPMPPEQLLVALEEDGDNDWKDGIEASQRIITIIAPKGSSISALAATSEPESGDVFYKLYPNFSTRKQISSLLFPTPNYYYESPEAVDVILPGKAEISVQLRGFFNDTPLTISFNGETHRLDNSNAELVFVSDTFQVGFYLAMNGERGILLDYHVGEKQNETDATTTLAISPSTEPHISTEKQKQPTVEPQTHSAEVSVSNPSTSESHDPTVGPHVPTAEQSRPTTESHASTTESHIPTEKPPPTAESHASTAAPHVTTNEHESPTTNPLGPHTVIHTGTADPGTTTTKAQQGSTGSSVQFFPLHVFVAVLALLQLVNV